MRSIPPKTMSKLLKAVRIIGVLAISLLVLAAGVWGYYLLPCDGEGREVRFRVDKGESFSHVSRRLAQEKLIRFRELFTAFARLQKRDAVVKVGEYRLDSSLSPADILDALCRGRVDLRKVTVPEGMTVSQIACILEDAGLADSWEILDADKDSQFLKELGLEGKGLEGYLFPDTYLFDEGVPARGILVAMVRRFREVYGPQLREEQKSIGLTLHQTVTLASIIEKETACGEERPIIASVLHNRLKVGMPLQCDPTVIYGIKDFDGNLTRKHLTTPNPYNTYLIKGLPPGPIGNPGLDSLIAALNPENTPYLYYVSRNDGTHQFSENLADHNHAVWKYQKCGGR